MGAIATTCGSIFNSFFQKKEGIFKVAYYLLSNVLLNRLEQKKNNFKKKLKLCTAKLKNDPTI